MSNCTRRQIFERRDFLKDKRTTGNILENTWGNARAFLLVIPTNPYYLLYLSWTQVFSGLETIQEEYGTILDSSTHVLPEKHDSVRFCSPYQKWEANEKESRGKALVPFLVLTISSKLNFRINHFY